MKNHKFSNIPPLVENDITINDSFEKSNILNTLFASKATVNNYEEMAPNLDPLENISFLGSVNTSPIEIAKFIRNITIIIMVTVVIIVIFIVLDLDFTLSLSSIDSLKVSLQIY